LIFKKFGEIKSCKVAIDPTSGKSKGYGYVWFNSEKSCTSALKAENLPYKV
jgi:poly(U)-binding-splicing factor PUF60